MQAMKLIGDDFSYTFRSQILRINKKVLPSDNVFFYSSADARIRRGAY